MTRTVQLHTRQTHTVELPINLSTYKHDTHSQSDPLILLQFWLNRQFSVNIWQQIMVIITHHYSSAQVWGNLFLTWHVLLLSRLRQHIKRYRTFLWEDTKYFSRLSNLFLITKRHPCLQYFHYIELIKDNFTGGLILNLTICGMDTFSCFC